MSGLTALEGGPIYLLLFYVLATSNVISGEVSIRDSVSLY